MPALTLNHSLSGQYIERGRTRGRPSYSVSFPEKPAWQEAVETQLNELQSLQIGWDGYGSVPVRGEVAKFAVDILRRNMKSSSPAPSIVPVSGGGLQIEWHQNQMDIELFISKPYECELYAQNLDSGEVIDEPLEADFSVLGTLIQQL